MLPSGWAPTLPVPCWPPAGILYETELIPLPASAALVRLRPAGDGQELAVEQLFGAALRCQPQGDFMQENAVLFRQAGALAYCRRRCHCHAVLSLPWMRCCCADFACGSSAPARPSPPTIH